MLVAKRKNLACERMMTMRTRLLTKMLPVRTKAGMQMESPRERPRNVAKRKNAVFRIPMSTRSLPQTSPVRTKAGMQMESHRERPRNVASWQESEWQDLLLVPDLGKSQRTMRMLTTKSTTNCKTNRPNQRKSAALSRDVERNNQKNLRMIMMKR